MGGPQKSGKGHGLHPAIKDPKPEAIVVYCSDPRFQTAFERFVRDDLGLPVGRHIAIVVGGGAALLGHPETLPRDFRFLRERIDHYRKKAFPSVRRLILINHENCRFYQSLKEKGLGFVRTQDMLEDRPQEDLAAVAEALAKWYTDLTLTVELYYARFANAEQTTVAFERVAGK